MVIGWVLQSSLSTKLESWCRWLSEPAAPARRSIPAAAGCLPGGSCGSARPSDWAESCLFSGFVLFDLNRAMRIPYTMNNAIDAAVEVYMDFINYCSGSYPFLERQTVIR